MTRVMVTGANGFVGKALCRYLTDSGFEVRAASRMPMPEFSENNVAVGDIDGETAWQEALQEVEVVVHLAARVHIVKETADDALAAFRQVNVAGTENLARQSCLSGVKRFIFLSTIKVNGEQGTRPFDAADSVCPQTPYAITKWEAERALLRIGSETGLEIVIIRPPLVYGPGVKGNFLNLMKWGRFGFPLPLKSIDNARSLVGVDNLCDLIRVCIKHPNAAGRTLTVADDLVYSTPLLIKLLAEFMRCPALLFPVPVKLLYRLGAIAGKTSALERLCGSLTVNTRFTYEALDWQPPFSAREELKKTVAWFMSRKR
ncbi:MAG: NAD-dependent epimerase/dehydratase family protein [Gammaproteobacteria bacterium]